MGEAFGEAGTHSPDFEVRDGSVVILSRLENQIGPEAEQGRIARLIGFLDELVDEFHRGFAKFRAAGFARLNDCRVGQEHKAEFHIRREGAPFGIVPFIEGVLPFPDLFRALPPFFQTRPYGGVNSLRKWSRQLDLLGFAGGNQIGKILCSVSRGILHRKNLDIAHAPESRISDGVFEITEIDSG